MDNHNPYDRHGEREKKMMARSLEPEPSLETVKVIDPPPRAIMSSDQSQVTLLRQALDGERGEDQKKIADLGLKLITTLLRKNTDYGCSAHKRPVLIPFLTPRQALLVRMSDKIHRLVNLMEKGAPEVQESIEDTMLDLPGYCILWLTAPAD